MAPSDFTVKGQTQGHEDFKHLYLLNPMLLLNNRKSYMGSPMAPSHFTLRDLERSKSMFTHV